MIQMMIDIMEKNRKRIDIFCKEHNITQSLKNHHTYTFEINGQKYEVYEGLTGKRLKEFGDLNLDQVPYNNESSLPQEVLNKMDKAVYEVKEKIYNLNEEPDVYYIHSNYIINVYNDLKAGYKLDHQGNRI